MELVIGSQRTVIIAVFTLFIVIQLVYAFHSRKTLSKTALDKYVSEFYTGGRGMGSVIVAFMVAASLSGAGVFMGMPGSAYVIGQSFFVICFFSLSANFIMLGTAGKKTGICARRGNLQSFISLLVDRFDRSKGFSTLSSVVLLVFLGMFAANTYTGGAKLFQAMTGQSYTMGLVIFTVMILVTAILGGITGVATAIAIQGVIMTVCCIVLFAFGVGSVGGFDNVFSTLVKTAPEWFAPNWSWQMVVGYAFLMGPMCIALPQGAMSSLVHKNTKSLHSAIKIGVVAMFIWEMCLNFLAPVARYTFPDLLINGYSADMAIPFLVINKMPSVAAGLCLAGVAAAVQSSINGMAVTLSSVVVKDLFEIWRPNTSAKTLKKVSQISTIAICIILFWWASDPPPLLALLVMYASGGLAAAFAAPIILGNYWPRANKYGASAAIIFGVAAYLLTDKKIILTFFPFGSVMAGVIVSFIAMIIVSLLTPKTTWETITRWFSPTYFGAEETYK